MERAFYVSPISMDSQPAKLNVGGVKINQIPTASKIHLLKVYATIFCGLIIWAVGVLLRRLQGANDGIVTLLHEVIMFWFYFTPSSKERKRFALLMAVVVLDGYYSESKFNKIVPLGLRFCFFAMVNMLVAMGVSTGCFTKAATLARGSNKYRKWFLYLLALVSSEGLMLLWLCVASFIFGDSVGAFHPKGYIFPLAVFGYITLDTNDMGEKERFGDLDFLKHAALCCTNYNLVLFVCLIIRKVKRKRRVEFTDRKSNVSADKTSESTSHPYGSDSYGSDPYGVIFHSTKRDARLRRTVSASSLRSS